MKQRKPHRFLEQVIKLNNLGWTNVAIGLKLGISKQMVYYIAGHDKRYIKGENRKITFVKSRGT